MTTQAPAEVLQLTDYQRQFLLTVGLDPRDIILIQSWGMNPTYERHCVHSYGPTWLQTIQRIRALIGEPSIDQVALRKAVEQYNYLHSAEGQAATCSARNIRIGKRPD